LIGARLDGNLPEAAEWTCATPKREEQGVAEEKSPALAALLRGGRAREGGLRYLLAEWEVNKRLVLLGTGDGADLEGLGVTADEDNPLATACAD
jgi:hypothetical protein